MNIQKWNAVMKALECLYRVYTQSKEPKNDPIVHKAVESLVKKYDEWLD